MREAEALTLIVARPSNRAIFDRINEVAFEEWGKGTLSFESFVRRETALRSTLWARRNQRNWVLLDDADRLVFACETFRQKAKLGDQAGYIECFASVVVPQALRGSGFGRTGFDRVLSVLKKEAQNDPKLFGSTLFSDVDPKFYEHWGFERLRGALEWTLPASAVDASWKTSDVREVLEIEREGVESIFQGRFALIADAPQFEWHRARSRIYHEETGSPICPIAGFCCGDSRIFLIVDGKLKWMRAMLCDFKSESEAKNLLHASADLTRKLGLPGLIGWDKLKNAEFLRVFSKKPGDSIPMFLPLRDCARATDWESCPRIFWT